MGRLKRYWLRWLLLVLLVLASTRLESCKSAVPELYPAADGKGIAVWVVDHGYHAGIVLPIRPLALQVPWVLNWAGSAPWMELGWGDGAIYRSGGSDIPWRLVPKALLWPTDSVFHLVAVPEPPAVYFGASSIIEIRLSEQGLAQLLAFDAATLPRDKCCPVVPVAAGIYGNSRFYPSKPSYHLFRTCNYWAAQALRAAGLAVAPSYAYHSGNLMYQLRKDPHAKILRP